MHNGLKSLLKNDLNRKKILYNIKVMMNATDVTTALTSLTDATDSMWILVSTILVFWMQAGFAMLESGCVRHKNSQNILFKLFYFKC